jgi:hypothetical protein
VSVARSTDAGATFGPASVVGRPGAALDAGTDARPQIVVDAQGHIVVAYSVFKDKAWNAQVLVATSTDGGATFGTPVRIDDGDPIGRVSIVLDSRAEPIVAWLEQRTTDEAEVLVRRVTGTTVGETRSLARTSGARQSGFPRLAVLRDTLLATWTTAKPAPQVHVARLPLSSSPR